MIMDFHGIEINGLLTTDRVTAGMALLDKIYPGHETSVDLDNLLVLSGVWCPLAQAAGMYYNEATDDLWTEHRIDLRDRYDENDQITMAQCLGFMLLDMEYSSMDLSDAWVAAYRARREAQLIK